MARRILRKNAKRTRRPRRSLRGGRSRVAPVSPVRAVVRKELARQVETKLAQYGGGLTFSTADDPNFYIRNVIRVDPGTEAGYNIVVGGQDSQRIGNKIRTKRCMFRGVFVPVPHSESVNAAPAPLEVVMWLIKIKGGAIVDTTSAVSNAVLAAFLEQNNTSLGLFGTLSDLVYPVNKNLFNVLATKRFKLGNSNYGSAGVQSNVQHYTNNDFKYNKILHWDLTKHLDKNYIWNDQSSSEPSNKHVYIVWQALRADGGVTNNVTGFDACSVNFRVDYTYTDS